MKILALDSSGLVASVAVAEDDNLLGEYTVNYKKTHSQTLLPMLDAVAQMIELDLDSVDAIAVSAGPGSFTGLRIGSATAKGLGLALEKPLIHVPTVDALACNLWGCGDLICPLMDARRNQTYTGIYRFVDGRLEVIREQCVVQVTEIIESLNALVLTEEVKPQEKSQMAGACDNIRKRFLAETIIRNPPQGVPPYDKMKKLGSKGQPEGQKNRNSVKDAGLDVLPKRVVFLGDGVPVFRAQIEETCRMPYLFAPAHMNKQRAASVAYLGMQYAREGRLETAAEHHPDYLRLSQAERERRERLKEQG